MKKKRKAVKEKLLKKDRLALLRQFLFKEWEAFSGQADPYHWAWEEKRWHELVVCLLLAVGRPALSAGEARTMVNALAELGFLDIDDLAAWVPKCRKPRFKNVHFDALVLVLDRHGLPPARSKIATVTIAEAAYSIQRRHAGKVQRYLRHYGELMLKELDRHFRFSRLSRPDRDRAFTHWLQNVINMPISMADPALQAICKDFGVSFDQLLVAADDLGLNLAMLDDMAVGMNRPTSPG